MLVKALWIWILAIVVVVCSFLGSGLGTLYILRTQGLNISIDLRHIESTNSD